MRFKEDERMQLQPGFFIRFIGNIALAVNLWCGRFYCGVLGNC